MDVTKLRKGNWVEIKDRQGLWGPAQVAEVYENGNIGVYRPNNPNEIINSVGLNGVKGTKITDYWIQRFGFVEDKDRGIWRLEFEIPGETGNFSFDASRTKEAFMVDYMSNKMILSIGMEYVDQMQNLYYDITKTELK